MTRQIIEERFLALVRQYSDLGYGRMLQIIKFEWSEHQPSRAAMEFPKGVPHTYLTVAQMMAAKQADPLADQWSVFTDEGSIHPTAGQSRIERGELGE